MTVAVVNYNQKPQNSSSESSHRLAQIKMPEERSTQPDLMDEDQYKILYKREFQLNVLLNFT